MAFHAAEPDPRLPRAAQRILQGLWLALVVPLCWAYASGLWLALRAPTNVCEVLGGPGCSDAAAAAVLAPLGLSLELASILISAFSDIGVPVGCLLFALFMFSRRPERLEPLATSAFVALYGLYVNTSLTLLGLEQIGLAWLSTIYSLLFYGLFYYVLLTFPTGRFVPRWGSLLLLLGVVAETVAVLWPTVLPADGATLALLIAGAGLAMQVYRYRRVSNQTEQQQTKWALVGMGTFLLNFLLYTVWIDPVMPLGYAALPHLVFFTPVNLVLVLALPAALMFATLRYRLWDIDIIIRRTLVYSTLTVLLALIYWGLVVVTQNVLRVATGAAQGGLVTVLSTLAVAALFGPLRRRVQAVIDRRFYRRRYDAGRIVAAFGETLRDEVSLERVTARLVEVVDDTLQPAQAGLWLKSPEKRG